MRGELGCTAMITSREELFSRARRNLRRGSKRSLPTQTQKLGPRSFGAVVAGRECGTFYLLFSPTAQHRLELRNFRRQLPALANTKDTCVHTFCTYIQVSTLLQWILYGTVVCAYYCSVLLSSHLLLCQSFCSHRQSGKLPITLLDKFSGCREGCSICLVRTATRTCCVKWPVLN